MGFRNPAPPNLCGRIFGYGGTSIPAAARSYAEIALSVGMARTWNVLPFACGGRLGGVAVPIRNLLRAESGVFGPEELKDIAAAFEATREHLGLTDRIDPATMMLAKLTIELAKQGQFTAASLRDRVASASWDSLVLVTRTGLIAFSTDR
jgi:hypothetical protein